MGGGCVEVVMQWWRERRVVYISHVGVGVNGVMRVGGIGKFAGVLVGGGELFTCFILYFYLNLGLFRSFAYLWRLLSNFYGGLKLERVFWSWIDGGKGYWRYGTDCSYMQADFSLSCAIGRRRLI